MYQVPTTDPNHPVTMYGDPDTYYYEPSGGHGLQDMNLPADVAWQSIIDFTLANTNGATLSPDFTIDTSSDLNQFTQAYFGWAFVLLYVPKDKYCDSYRIHIGSVDDGVQAMANAKILGYANLGDTNKYINMVENGTSNLVLRPGINEVVLIHEDQQATQRYVHDVWIEHDGVQIPLAPKSIPWGQVTDKTTMKPIYQANVGVSGNGVSDSFTTGPFGFYFFESLADGTYALTANAAGYKQKTANVSVALGTAATEVVRTDFALDVGVLVSAGQEMRAERRLPRPLRAQRRVRRDLHRPDGDLRQRRLRPQSVRHADVLARVHLPGRDAGDAARADRAVRRGRVLERLLHGRPGLLRRRVRDRQLRRRRARTARPAAAATASTRAPSCTASIRWSA